MFAAGVWIYVRATRPRDRIGRWGFIGVVALLALAYVANVTAPPPASVRELYLTAIIGAAVTLVWTWWADRHRVPALTSEGR